MVDYFSGWELTGGLDGIQDRGVVFHTYGDVSNMAADQTIHGSVTFN